MAYVERPLNTESTVSEFFDNIDVNQLFEEKQFCDAVSNMMADLNLPVANSKFELKQFLINRICELQIKSEDYQSNNIIIKNTHRNSNYHSNNQREKLRQEILECCLGCEKSKNDDDTSKDLTKDGIRPNGPIHHDKKAFLLIGGPASGKSTYANAIASKYGAYLLDADIIKRKIPEYYLDDAGAALVHEESKLIYDNILQVIKAMNANLITPIVGKNYESLKIGVDAYISAGYDVTVILINVDKLEATRRALKRYVFTRRYVPLNYVLDTCGHEATASFYKIACAINDLKVLEIRNGDRPGTIEFSRGCDDLVKMLLDDNVVKEN